MPGTDEPLTPEKPESEKLRVKMERERGDAG